MIELTLLNSSFEHLREMLCRQYCLQSSSGWVGIFGQLGNFGQHCLSVLGKCCSAVLEGVLSQERAAQESQERAASTAQNQVLSGAVLTRGAYRKDMQIPIR